ncbi:fibronectin type III-like domain-contianing protein [Streptomyces sp. NPDC058534]|uniref:fibronectin type III-like domain-contianing protein n=1 Tax=Streptomyces sp. NPDC058534 TaxID=3346541 RepID=UPI00365A4970
MLLAQEARRKGRPRAARPHREPARVEVTVELPCRAFEVWDEATGSWAFVKGSYELGTGRSIADRRITSAITV